MIPRESHADYSALMLIRRDLAPAVQPEKHTDVQPVVPLSAHDARLIHALAGCLAVIRNGDVGDARGAAIAEAEVALSIATIRWNL